MADALEAKRTYIINVLNGAGDPIEGCCCPGTNEDDDDEGGEDGENGCCTECPLPRGEQCELRLFTVFANCNGFTIAGTNYILDRVFCDEQWNTDFDIASLPAEDQAEMASRCWWRVDPNFTCSNGGMSEATALYVSARRQNPPGNVKIKFGVYVIAGGDGMDDNEVWDETNLDGVDEDCSDRAWTLAQTLVGPCCSVLAGPSQELTVGLPP